MNRLIKVDTSKDRPTVLARDLHTFLEIRTDFRHWFPRMCEYGFTEGSDYTPVIFDHPQNNQKTLDYQLTIDMAKEISMIQRTEKGKQARQYFLEIEKRWNDPSMVMARALKIADTKVKRLEQKVEADRPKVVFAEALEVAKSSILVGELAKLLRQNGIDIGQNRLFKWLRNNGFLGNVGENYNLPTQYSMDLRLFEIKKSVITNADGLVRTTRTPKVTGKGQIYFINKFKENNIARQA